MSGAAPLSREEFAALLARLGPFEPHPHLAVGVSGGRDSMALALLTDEWARDRGGVVSALIVDHGLRAQSAAEAEQVATMLRARAIAVEVLRWEGAKPRTAIQEKAREARRALLERWCAQRGVLHLLLAHHADDQAETIAMRAERASGPDGLAGMSAIVETADLRVLRPLLAAPRARLAATLAVRRQAWIDDPSNLNAAFKRTALRCTVIPAVEPAAAVARIVRERRVNSALARHVAIYPEGWAQADPQLFTDDHEIGAAALSRLVTSVGGQDYAPRRERVMRLAARLNEGALVRTATLGGCLVAPGRAGISVVREPETAASVDAPLWPGTLVYDRRFVVRWLRGATSGVRLGPLGRQGWAQVIAARPDLRDVPLPYPVKIGLPAARDLDGVREVPHLLYRRNDVNECAVYVASVAFRPAHVLASAGFVLI